MICSSEIEKGISNMVTEYQVERGVLARILQGLSAIAKFKRRPSVKPTPAALTQQDIDKKPAEGFDSNSRNARMAQLLGR